jgi:hypothetical protein
VRCQVCGLVPGPKKSVEKLAAAPAGGIPSSVQAKQTHCGLKLRLVQRGGGLAAGSQARRPAPALNEIREFRKAMPRPRRGSELLVFGGPRAAKSSCRCHHTHPTTGNPHVSRMSVWSFLWGALAWPLRQELLAARRGLLATLPAQRGACIHNWTSREPVFAAGEGDMLAHPLNKGLMAQAYL